MMMMIHEISMRRTLYFFLFIEFFVFAFSSVQAQLRFDPVFSDHMVLQREPGGPGPFAFCGSRRPIFC
jgi:hypothetical protein